MTSKFSNYPDIMRSYHLYASKQSIQRTGLAQKILPSLTTIDQELQYHESYTKVPIQEGVLEMLLSSNALIENFEDYKERRLQYQYFLTDYLLFTPIYLQLQFQDYLPRIADILIIKMEPYVVLHELAILSWYDLLIDPLPIMVRLSEYQLNQTEIYHILGEMSLCYPRKIVEFLAETQILNEYFSHRFVKKLRNSRKRKLQKDMEIRLTLSEVNELIREYDMD